MALVVQCSASSPCPYHLPGPPSAGAMLPPRAAHIPAPARCHAPHTVMPRCAPPAPCRPREMSSCPCRLRYGRCCLASVADVTRRCPARLVASGQALCASTRKRCCCAAAAGAVCAGSSRVFAVRVRSVCACVKSCRRVQQRRAWLSSFRQPVMMSQRFTPAFSVLHMPTS